MSYREYMSYSAKCAGEKDCESRWHREYYFNYSSLTERYISVKDFYISEGQKYVTHQTMAGLNKTQKNTLLIKQGEQ